MALQFLFYLLIFRQYILLFFMNGVHIPFCPHPKLLCFLGYIILVGLSIGPLEGHRSQVSKPLLRALSPALGAKSCTGRNSARNSARKTPKPVTQLYVKPRAAHPGLQLRRATPLRFGVIAPHAALVPRGLQFVTLPRLCPLTVGKVSLTLSA